MGEERRAGGEFVQSLARGLEVLGAFDGEHPSMTLSEVAARVDVSRAVARRFLLTLVDLGYVRAEGRQFALTPHVLELGSGYLAGLGLPEIAQPHLDALRDAIGESTSVAVLDGHDIVYVARSTAQNILVVGITIGTRFPAHATSMGRVLLAALPKDELDRYLASADLTAPTRRTVTDPDRLRTLLAEAADRGWCAIDEELAAGLRSVAVPLRDRSGQIVAAANIAATTAQDPAAAYLEALNATASAIERDMKGLRSRRQ